jgi:two-component system cell cycle response regulator DivK
MSRVLVVEDNDMNRELVRALLEHHGHEVDEAISADTARRAFAATPYDLVVMDIQFPGGGGESVLVELRQSTAGAVPIIALTALAMTGDRERLLRLGFDGYVSKPLDTRAFVVEVERLLKRGGVAS